MIDEDGHVKVGDFGMCKDGVKREDFARTFCGTPDYMAPEIVMKKPYGMSCDWYVKPLRLSKFPSHYSPRTQDLVNFPQILSQKSTLIIL